MKNQRSTLSLLFMVFSPQNYDLNSTQLNFDSQQCREQTKNETDTHFGRAEFIFPGRNFVGGCRHYTFHGCHQRRYALNFIIISFMSIEES